MSRIIDYKIGKLTIDDFGQRWVKFRYWFKDKTTHSYGPVSVDSKEDALQKCSDARYLIDSCHRKQHPDAPKMPPYTDDQRAAKEAEVEGEL